MSFELDRVRALDLWRNVTVMTVRGEEPDLTARQLAVLMTVHLGAPPHTVRGLAAALGVGKPAITRALDTLTRYGLVRRRRDEADGRNVFVERTVRGQEYLTSLGDMISGRAAELMAA
ncbi:MAG: MarR family transcriptional regulator [Alphaproteobacteria bacterium]|nr:MarR family transcriptional regulator [Alphaproteobacteria bacterium]